MFWTVKYFNKMIGCEETVIVKAPSRDIAGKAYREWLDTNGISFRDFTVDQKASALFEAHATGWKAVMVHNV